jgi:hypothetical protein
LWTGELRGRGRARHGKEQNSETEGESFARLPTPDRKGSPRKILPEDSL